jgi:hypothetical protein
MHPLISTRSALLLFLCSISIYRINLFPNKVPFQLVLPLVCSLPINYYCILQLLKKRIKLSKSVLLFSLLSSAFVIYLGLTLYQSEDAIQIKRYILLAYTIGTVVLFSFLFSNLSKIVQYNILKKTIIFSVIIYLVFCGIESYAFIKLGSNPGGNFYDWIEIYPDTIGFFLPRLSGGFIDPNLAAFYLIAMYFFADFLSLKRWIKLLIIVLIFLTISRSAIAILIILMIINLLSKKWKIDFSFRPKIAIKLLLTFIIAMTGIAAGSLYILNNYSNRVNTQYFLIGINNRFGHDLSEGSGSIHRQLITKGFNDSFTHYVYALI